MPSSSKSSSSKSLPSSSNSSLSEYELRRQRNLKRNAEVLKSLGLGGGGGGEDDFNSTSSPCSGFSMKPHRKNKRRYAIHLLLTHITHTPRSLKLTLLFTQSS